jgi:hypothetical protein
MSAWLNLFDLNSKCSIKKPIYLTDSYSNPTTAWSTLASNEPCAFWQGGGPEVVIGDRVHNPKNYTLAISPSTQYDGTCRVVISGSTFGMGNPFNVNAEDAIMVCNLESLE